MNLRKLLKEVEKVKNNLDSGRKKIRELISELEDESKLGVPTDYDFGLKRIKEAKKELRKLVKMDMGLLKDILKAIKTLQINTKKKLSPDARENKKR